MYRRRERSQRIEEFFYVRREFGWLRHALEGTLDSKMGMCNIARFWALAHR